MPKESQYDFIMRTHNVYFPRCRWELAQLSGVSLDTLNKVFQQQTKNPKASTVQKIYDVLYERDSKAKGSAEGSQAAEPSSIASEPVLV